MSDLDSLLGLDSEEQAAEETSSEEQGSTEEKKQENPKEQYVSKAEHEKLKRSYDDQLEFVRQQQERVKELSKWKDNITGKSEEDKGKEIEKEIRDRFEEDPLSVINDLVNKKVNELTKTVESQRMTSQMERIMGDVDKDYEVNWDRDYKKITDQLEYFSEKAKKEKPREVLLAACRSAGVLKTRENPPYVESGHGVTPSKTNVDKQLKQMKQNILKAAPKRFL